MNAIFDRVIREFFPDTNIPHWKKWVFRAAFGNKVFSRLINDERLIDKNGVHWVSSVIDFLTSDVKRNTLTLIIYPDRVLQLLFQIIRR
ncbi:Uncharacterised protein [Klebsiella variicola]|nr:Uncharacterised protein [Klebsiella variicola]